MDGYIFRIVLEIKLQPVLIRHKIAFFLLQLTQNASIIEHYSHSYSIDNARVKLSTAFVCCVYFYAKNRNQNHELVHNRNACLYLRIVVTLNFI